MKVKCRVFASPDTAIFNIKFSDVSPPKKNVYSLAILSCLHSAASASVIETSTVYRSELLSEVSALNYEKHLHCYTGGLCELSALAK